MVSYALRTFPVILAALASPKGAKVSRLERAVSWRQIDLNVHMNQAVYAQVGELGRADLLLRSGAWRTWRRQDIKPVVAEQRIVYRRELKAGTRYVVDTRAIGVEGRLLVFEGWIVVGDKAHAKLEAKLIFVGKGGVLAPERVAELCAPFVTEALPVVDWTVASSA